MQEQERATQERDGTDGVFEGIVGRHPSMLAIFEVIRRVAPTDATVLITGESGTGKELVAAALHRLSARATGRFVPVHSSPWAPFSQGPSRLDWVPISLQRTYIGR